MRKLLPTRDFESREESLGDNKSFALGNNSIFSVEPYHRDYIGYSLSSFKKFHCYFY